MIWSDPRHIYCSISPFTDTVAEARPILPLMLTAQLQFPVSLAVAFCLTTLLVTSLSEII